MSCDYHVIFKIYSATPGSHQTVNRTPSAGIHVSPTKHHPVTTGGGGIRRGGVNDKYQFPGELGTKNEGLMNSSDR